MTTPNLPTLLASGEHAAFHGKPAAAVAYLEQAVALAGSHGQFAESTAACWLLGVSLGASGRYGGALTVLLIYTRARVPTRVGVVTHHPLRSTIPASDAPMGAEFVPSFRRVA